MFTWEHELYQFAKVTLSVGVNGRTLREATQHPYPLVVLYNAYQNGIKSTLFI